MLQSTDIPIQTMTDPLPITPCRRALDHHISLPGSKSLTNRALILAALASGETRLEAHCLAVTC